METIFGGRYRILSTIGKGGMGTVYLAESTSLGTKWAIKAIEKKKGGGVDLLAEPNILKRLNHPALPRIVDIEQDEEYLYIIEDYIEGMPLDRQLGAQGRFAEDTVIAWTVQLCQVLMYLHSQPNPIIYRDMKPANIIVSTNSNLKLIDFGIAREYKSGSGSDTTYMGTRGYAAPEQYGTGQTDARTDIYSLGATMYHLLTGISPNDPPYFFRDLREIDRGFSEGIAYIVKKCIQNDPRDRYQTVAELLYDLNHIYVFNGAYRRRHVFGGILTAFKLVLLLGFSALLLYSFQVINDEKVVAAQQEIDQIAAKYDDYYTEGVEALERLHYDDADKAFDSAIETDATRTEAYVKKAEILWKQVRYDDCADYLEKAAKSCKALKTDPEYNYIYGASYFDNDEFGLALPYLEQAAELSESDEDTPVDYLRDLGVCNARLGYFRSAEDILERIVDSKFDDVSEYVRGEIELAKEHYEDAIELFTSAKDNTSDDYLKRKSYLALSDVYKALRQEEHIPGVISENVFRQIEVLEEAMRKLYAEDDIILTETLAEAYYTALEFDKAKIRFSKLLDLGYVRPYIYRNLAIIEQQQQHLDTAENWLTEMIDKYPDNFEGYLQLGYICIERENAKAQDLRDYSNAVENYNLACQFAPQGAKTLDVQPLGDLIDELRSKGWL